MLLALTITAQAKPITVSATPLATFGNLSIGTDFGPLRWRGGLVLTSGENAFGGLSGLALSDDCAGVLAVSDAGRWFRASLTYEDGRLSNVSNAEIAPMLDSSGRPPRNKSEGDAEALASLGNGRYLAGFESRPRIGIYDIKKSGLGARFQLLRSPKAIAEGPRNGELESVGHFTEGPWKGYYLAIAERNAEGSGNIRGWLWQSWKTIPFVVRHMENYSITDAAILPGGDILLLERSASFLPGMALSRIKANTIESGEIIEPQLLFSGHAPFYAIDNMEGIAVCKHDGETRLTIVSDNNFNAGLQRTMLLQFAYTP